MPTKLVWGLALCGAGVTLGAGGLLMNGKASEAARDEAVVALPERVSHRPDAAPPSRSQSVGRSEQDEGWDSFGDRFGRFDTDGDGMVSDAERRAGLDALRTEWSARADTNGDGVADDEERLNAVLDSSWGDRLKERFDADADGTIDGAERGAIREEMARRESARHDRRVQRWDADADGLLSQAEEQAGRKADQAGREARMRELTGEFDADLDGNLNADERTDAWRTLRERRVVDAFMGRYDTNGDRVVSSTDFNAFLASYQSELSRADVNRDGAVDTLDVTAFRDMMVRAGNRP